MFTFKKRITSSDIKSIVLKKYNAYIYFNDKNGSVEVIANKKGFTAKIGGFSADNFMVVCKLAKDYKWKPIGNASFTAGHDLFCEIVEDFVISVAKNLGSKSVELS